MKTVCEKNMCAGCMACIEICPREAIKIQDDLFAYNAIIDEKKCINCNACSRICQRNNPVERLLPKEWYQGWAEDAEVRKKGSSGGCASAITEAFVDNGGIVCSCVFKSGEFVFEFADSKDEIQKFSGSKYVKSNPLGTYNSIKKMISNGKKVLFIGLPCQVSAIRNFMDKKYEDNLYTCDLICHGTPSPKLLDMFLNQYGKKLTEIKNVQFRQKAKFMLYCDNKGVVTKGVSDKYSIAFLNSLIYTENCYSCSYASGERVSDITLGDSWGSELPQNECDKGVSLLLCQSDKGKELLQMSRIHLEDVNINRAIANNHQLEYSSKRPKGRMIFFKNIKSKKKFNFLVFREFPKQCARQNIKQILIKLKLMQR